MRLEQRPELVLLTVFADAVHVQLEPIFAPVLLPRLAALPEAGGLWRPTCWLAAAFGRLLAGCCRAGCRLAAHCYPLWLLRLPRRLPGMIFLDTYLQGGSPYTHHGHPSPPPQVGEPGFTWEDQIAYRIDYWLSNYPSSKTIFLLIITGILIAIGALVYLPVDMETDTLDAALWMSWCLPASCFSLCWGEKRKGETIHPPVAEKSLRSC